jgi:radical SAM superfamily enzyme YgiQ (UPF0313 family)
VSSEKSPALLISANTERFPEPVFPIGAAYLADALEKRGHPVRIFDAGLFRNPQKELEKLIEALRPAAVGISLRNIDNAAWPHVRSYLDWYRTIASTIRRSTQVPLIIGGSAFSIFPVELVDMLSPDCGVTGDGEAAVDCFFNSNYPIDPSDMTGNPSNRKIINGRLENLDSVAFPRNIGAIFPEFGRYRTIGIQTARGCPRHCIYCTYPILEGSRLRLRPPEAVAEELEMLCARFGKQEFFIVDSLFNADEQHMERVLRAIIARRIKIRFSCYLMPRMADLSLFGLLREAGCIAVDFGTDSGSPSILHALRKNFSVQDVRNVSAACAKAGIDYCHSLLFGGPGESVDTIHETVALMDELNPAAIIAMTGIRIYPGTPLAKLAAADGLIEPGTSMLHPVFYGTEETRQDLRGMVATISASRKNWFMPGGKDWSSSLWPRLLRLLHRSGPLWRALSPHR